MKKLITIILAVAMCATMAITAFASEVEGESQNVKGSYEDGTEETIWSVTITWGSMNFLYTSASQGDWDPESRTYSNPIPAKWTSIVSDGSLDDNQIKVSNSSNEPVVASLAFTNGGGSVANIVGTFMNAATGGTAITQLEIASAEGTAESTAPEASAWLILSGDPTEAYEENTVIGSITITFN